MKTKIINISSYKGLRKAYKLKGKGWKIKKIEWTMTKNK